MGVACRCCENKQKYRASSTISLSSNAYDIIELSNVMKLVIFSHLIVRYSLQHQGTASFYNSKPRPFRAQLAICLDPVLHLYLGVIPGWLKVSYTQLHPKHLGLRRIEHKHHFCKR